MVMRVVFACRVKSAGKRRHPARVNAYFQGTEQPNTPPERRIPIDLARVDTKHSHIFQSTPGALWALGEAPCRQSGW